MVQHSVLRKNSIQVPKRLCSAVSAFVQKQPFRGVFRKRCSQNTQQIYRNSQTNLQVALKLYGNLIS